MHPICTLPQQFNQNSQILSIPLWLIASLLKVSTIGSQSSHLDPGYKRPKRQPEEDLYI